MAVTESFKIFIADQLAPMNDLVIKKMFGGCGLYQEGYFFGILADDRVYFKTDEKSRKRYEKKKMKAFRPTEKQILKNYFEVPLDILEDGKSLFEWAREAILISQKQALKKK